MSSKITRIALAGCPNVGKSTVFNALTGLNQHTGNWPGKTVDTAQGKFTYKNETYLLVDLPGTYSLTANSAEEEVTRDYLQSSEAEAVIIVCDACSLERNLNLVLQILEITERTVVCVNLMDEAKKKGIRPDLKELSCLLGVPVVGAAARSGEGLGDLCEAVQNVCKEKRERPVLHIKGETDEERRIERIRFAEEIANEVLNTQSEASDKKDRRLDKILTGRFTALPVMILLLAFVFWITVTGANVPSQYLSKYLFEFGEILRSGLIKINSPAWLVGIIIDGGYKVLAWVVSVMLPPMAIFFPLFTLLEDFGYLPRVAFNLDGAFQKCRACGKQGLTMCMGLGCNAVGVTGCRIIDSPRERLIAIITNSLVPCNGRFPTIIALISMFFAAGAVGAGRSILSAVMLLGVILLGVLMTFAASKILSYTVLNGVPSSFTLELPPYRMPQFGKVIIRSVFDRTLFVLGRAAAVAAPAGVFIWILANVNINGESILSLVSSFLDPIGVLMGLDGVILLAFILGFPANEIVLPIMIMTYLNAGTIQEMTSLFELRSLLVANSWTPLTAVCVLLFSLMHWPCSTTCLTIKKETDSLKWTAVSVLTPTVMGFLSCVTVATVTRLVCAFI